jgi:hypothetical protein
MIWILFSVYLDPPDKSSGYSDLPPAFVISNGYLLLYLGLFDEHPGRD